MLTAFILGAVTGAAVVGGFVVWKLYGATFRDYLAKRKSGQLR